MYAVNSAGKGPTGVTKFTVPLQNGLFFNSSVLNSSKSSLELDENISIFGLESIEIYCRGIFSNANYFLLNEPPLYVRSIPPVEMR